MINLTTFEKPAQTSKLNSGRLHDQTRSIKIIVNENENEKSPFGLGTTILCFVVGFHETRVKLLLVPITDILLDLMLDSPTHMPNRARQIQTIKQTNNKIHPY